MNDLERIQYIISCKINNLYKNEITNEKYKYNGLLYYNEYKHIYKYNNVFIIDMHKITKINDNKYIHKYKYEDIDKYYLKIYFFIDNYNVKQYRFENSKLKSKVLSTGYSIIKHDFYNGNILLVKVYNNNEIQIDIKYNNNKINYKKHFRFDELFRFNKYSLNINNYKFNI